MNTIIVDKKFNSLIQGRINSLGRNLETSINNAFDILDAIINHGEKTRDYQKITSLYGKLDKPEFEGLFEAVKKAAHGRVPHTVEKDGTTGYYKLSGRDDRLLKTKAEITLEGEQADKAAAAAKEKRAAAAAKAKATKVAKADAAALELEKLKAALEKAQSVKPAALKNKLDDMKAEANASAKIIEELKKAALEAANREKSLKGQIALLREQVNDLESQVNDLNNLITRDKDDFDRRETFLQDKILSLMQAA